MMSTTQMSHISIPYPAIFRGYVYGHVWEGHTWEQKEAPRARNQPQQGQQNRQGRDNNGVNPSGLNPGIKRAQVIQVVTDDTGNDLDLGGKSSVWPFFL